MATCFNPKCVIVEFHPKRRHQIYCSLRCRTAHKNERWPLRREKQILRGVYPEPLHYAQGRSQRKGERAQNDTSSGAASASDASPSRTTPETSGVTPLGRIKAAPRRRNALKSPRSAKAERVILWEKDGAFSRTHEPGARAAIKGRYSAGAAEVLVASFLSLAADWKFKIANRKSEIRK